MKRITASQARREWFRLLDEIVAGETVVIDRNGVPVVLRREDESQATSDAELPDYRGLIRVPDVEEAHRWGWSWDPDEGLIFRARENDG